jgi:hypothetical protein
MRLDFVLFVVLTQVAVMFINYYGGTKEHWSYWRVALILFIILVLGYLTRFIPHGRVH